jgi:hypothetical protein
MRTAQPPAAICCSIGRHVVIGWPGVPPDILVNGDERHPSSRFHGSGAWRVNGRALSLWS